MEGQIHLSIPKANLVRISEHAKALTLLRNFKKIRNLNSFKRYF
jgi:hypothetical protein